jgi:hypothetical protein
VRPEEAFCHGANKRVKVASIHLFWVIGYLDEFLCPQVWQKKRVYRSRNPLKESAISAIEGPLGGIGVGLAVMEHIGEG